MNSDKSKKNKLQMIVNDGLIYNRKDMLMLLRDIGNVNYYEIAGGEIMNKGKGFIYRVCANSEEPTLFLSGRIYINVSSFSHLKLSKIKGSTNTLFELVGDTRTIKLVPSLKDKLDHPLIKGTFADKMAELGIFSDEMFLEGNMDLPFEDDSSDN
ncbi:hypothetical protein ACFL4F_02265 [Candidatus Margulisiibacteriota bacterium]